MINSVGSIEVVEYCGWMLYVTVKARHTTWYATWADARWGIRRHGDPGAALETLRGKMGIER